MKEELERMMEDYDESYGTFQIGRLIVARAGGTLYGMYHQALRELNGRCETLKGLHLEQEELLVDMSESVEKRSDTKTSRYDMEREAIKVKRCQMRMHTLKKKIERKMAEVNRLFGMASDLKAEIGEITPELRDKFETEANLYYIKLCAVIELKSSGRLSYGSIESIFALEPMQRRQLIEELDNKDKVNEFLSIGCMEPPPIRESLTEDEIKGLIE